MNKIELEAKQNYEVSNYMINDFILKTASTNNFFLITSTILFN